MNFIAVQRQNNLVYRTHEGPIAKLRLWQAKPNKLILKPSSMS